MSQNADPGSSADAGVARGRTSPPPESSPAVPTEFGDGSARPSPPCAGGMSSGPCPTPSQLESGTQFDLAATPLHPEARLERRARGGEVDAAYYVWCEGDWAIVEVACDKCCARQPLAAFARSARSRAVRRIRRAILEEHPMARGRGSIRCRSCVLATKAPKNLVLEAIQAGHLRGTMATTVELQVQDLPETKVAFKVSRDLGSGQSLKTMEADVWAEAADWAAECVGPFGTSSEETDEEEHSPEEQ